MHRIFKTVGLLGGAGLLAFGCAHEKAEEMSPVAQNQKQSEQALQAASDAQKKASEAQQKADKAQAHVKDLQQQLATAQSEAVQSRTQAQQLQRQALMENQRASQTVQMSQQGALQAQKQEHQQANRATEVVRGTLTKAGSREIELTRLSDQKPLQVEVTQNTVVMLNGQPSFASQIRPGTPVRVSFLPGTALPVATRIDAGIIATSPQQMGQQQGQMGQQEQMGQQQEQTGAGGSGHSQNPNP